jgi:hypothetical protein
MHELLSLHEVRHWDPLHSWVDYASIVFLTTPLQRVLNMSSRAGKLTFAVVKG